MSGQEKIARQEKLAAELRRTIKTEIAHLGCGDALTTLLKRQCDAVLGSPEAARAEVIDWAMKAPMLPLAYLILGLMEAIAEENKQTLARRQ